jgi:uncharacterized protein YecE (DUF72 family)
LYSEDELSAWVSRLNEMAEKAQNVYVVTNNHYRGQAVVNALELKALLAGTKVDAPPMLQREFADLTRFSAAASSAPEQGRLFE